MIFSWIFSCGRTGSLVIAPRECSTQLVHHCPRGSYIFNLYFMVTFKGYDFGDDL